MTVCARWDDYRTYKWLDKVACPDLLLAQVQELLAFLLQGRENIVKNT